MSERYENILNAVKSSGKLTPAQELENYDAFSKMQKDGVYLPDLMKKIAEIDSLKKKFDEISQKRPIDEELFAVMETAVKNIQSVKDARQRMTDEKARVISEICMHDEGYKKAFEDYRTEVNRAYVSSRESKKESVV